MREIENEFSERSAVNAPESNDGVIRYALVEGVGVLSFNRPHRHNALNDELLARWSEQLLAAIDDPRVRCILLRGEGRSFSSGRDTTQLGYRAKGQSDLDFVRDAQQVRLATLDAPKPVVAAVQGNVIGAGCEISLSADIRIAATDAVFSFPEIRYGLLADTGGTQLLTVLAGPARAKRLLMTGGRFTAQDALQWGLVDSIVAPEVLDEKAASLCRELAAAPPAATALIKQLVDQAWCGAIRNGMRQEVVAQAVLFAGEEFRAAKAALQAAPSTERRS